MYLQNSPYGAMMWSDRGHCGGWHRCHQPATQGADLLQARLRTQLAVAGTAETSGTGDVSTSVSAVVRSAVAVSMGSSPAGDNAGVYDAALLRKQSASLNILTQDGDAIAIRFRSREAIEVHGTVPDQSAAGSTDVRVYSFSSGRVEIAVRGELDADEQQAIGDLVEKIDALASGFFGGDVEAAFSAATELGFDADEIASFSLRLILKESVRASAPVALQQPELQPAASQTLETPQTAPAEPQVSAPETQPPQEAVAPTATPETEATAEPAAVSEASPAAAPVEAGDTEQVPTLQDILGNYVRQIVDRLAQIDTSGSFEVSMRWKLRMVAAAVQTPAQPEATESPAAKLAGDTLRSVATSQP